MLFLSPRAGTSVTFLTACQLHMNPGAAVAPLPLVLIRPLDAEETMGLPGHEPEEAAAGTTVVVRVGGRAGRLLVPRELSAWSDWGWEMSPPGKRGVPQTGQPSPQSPRPPMGGGPGPVLAEGAKRGLLVHLCGDRELQ